MKKLALTLPFVAFAALGQAFTSNSLEAFDNATVQPGGPRTGANGKNFFNIEGSSYGNFSSFGVADFNGSDLSFGGDPVAMITGISLSFVQSNAGFTTDGALRFFVTTSTADIQPGSSLVYNSAFGENGIGSQLDPIELLGTGTFTEIANGTVDTYNFDNLSAGASAMLTNAYLSDSLVRIVIAPDSATTAATWAGFSNSTLAGPTLTLTGEAVPEPATMVAIALGATALMRRRRSK